MWLSEMPKDSLAQSERVDTEQDVKKDSRFDLAVGSSTEGSE
jgi:hypothetical protein